MVFDPNIIKQDFPIFANHGEKPLVYLDNASTTQKPARVLAAVNAYYSSFNANTHRALYKIGEKATEEYELVREKIRKFLNVPDSHSVIFTRSTTESINLVSYAWAREKLKPGDEILITQMEHHSNLVPWQLAAKNTGAVLKYIPITDSGTLDLSNLNKLLTSRTKIVAVAHQSNVFGTINPIDKIISKAHAAGALILIDGAQSTPHFPVDLSLLDPDFFAFSGHKMVGPTGVGVLIGRTEILDSMEPFLSGGEMIETVTMAESTWNKIPWKFEAGTPNIAQVIGLGAALDYLDEIGLDVISAHEQKINAYALNSLAKIPGMHIYGNPPHRGAVIPFVVGDIHSHDLAKFLDQDGICIRVGQHCTQPIMDYFGISGLARISMYIYNTEEDIDFLCKSIENIAHIFA